MDDYQSMDASLGRHALDLARQEWGGLRSINSALSGLVSEPDRTCTVGGQWYVVSIEHQQESLAKSEVAARGMVPYLPLMPRRERHGRGAHRTAWRPMLGLYMFVKCLPFQWGAVMCSRGVRRFLGHEGVPQAIDGGCIEVVRLIEAEEAESERARALMDATVASARAKGRTGIIWNYAEGEMVRIKSGPFAMFYAELTAAADVHDRVKAVVTLFGRSNIVELSAFEIERMGVVT